MNVEELKQVFVDIANAAGTITGNRQNHYVALAILGSCEQTLEKLEKEGIKNDDKNADNA